MESLSTLHTSYLILFLQEDERKKTKMLPILTTCGLPLSLSSISRDPLAIYKEIADHDRRREAIKKMKLEENSQTIGDRTRGDVRSATVKSVTGHDFARISSMACTAKAA
ncbi:hypothetical protein ACP275_14G258500 [Erythranthe tilingii]